MSCAGGSRGWVVVYTSEYEDRRKSEITWKGGDADGGGTRGRESSELVWVATVGVQGVQCVGAVVVRWERGVVGRGGEERAGDVDVGAGRGVAGERGVR